MSDETATPKRILCLPLLNEIWALELRLPYEYPFYDRFVIVEGTKTFAGRDKRLYFPRYRDRFEQYMDKIEYWIVDDLPQVLDEQYVGTRERWAPENRWPLERHTRNAFRGVLRSLGLAGDDIVFVADIDEILDIEKMSRLFAEPAEDNDYYVFSLLDYRGSIYAQAREAREFRGGYAIKHKHIGNDLFFLRAATCRGQSLSIPGFSRCLFPSERDLEMSSFVDVNLEMRVVPQAGWHFSHMSGGLQEWLKFKVQNFSHSESSVGETPVATERDWVDALEEFIAGREYQFDGVDPDVPGFVTGRLPSFKILLNPKK